MQGRPMAGLLDTHGLDKGTSEAESQPSMFHLPSLVPMGLHYLGEKVVYLRQKFLWISVPLLTEVMLLDISINVKHPGFEFSSSYNIVIGRCTGCWEFLH